eukprot:gene18791-29015_t
MRGRGDGAFEEQLGDPMLHFTIGEVVALVCLMSSALVVSVLAYHSDSSAATLAWHAFLITAGSLAAAGWLKERSSRERTAAMVLAIRRAQEAGYPVFWNPPHPAADRGASRLRRSRFRTAGPGSKHSSTSIASISTQSQLTSGGVTDASSFSGPGPASSGTNGLTPSPLNTDTKPSASSNTEPNLLAAVNFAFAKDPNNSGGTGGSGSVSPHHYPAVSLASGYDLRAAADASSSLTSSTGAAKAGTASSSQSFGVRFEDVPRGQKHSSASSAGTPAQADREARDKRARSGNPTKSDAATASAATAGLSVGHGSQPGGDARQVEPRQRRTSREKRVRLPPQPEGHAAAEPGPPEPEPRRSAAKVDASRGLRDSATECTAASPTDTIPVSHGQRSRAVEKSPATSNAVCRVHLMACSASADLPGPSSQSRSTGLQTDRPMNPAGETLIDPEARRRAVKAHAKTSSAMAAKCAAPGVVRPELQSTAQVAANLFGDGAAAKAKALVPQPPFGSNARSGSAEVEELTSSSGACPETAPRNSKPKQAPASIVRPGPQTAGPRGCFNAGVEPAAEWTVRCNAEDDDNNNVNVNSGSARRKDTDDSSASPVIADRDSRSSSAEAQHNLQGGRYVTSDAQDVQDTTSSGGSKTVSTGARSGSEVQDSTCSGGLKRDALLNVDLDSGSGMAERQDTTSSVEVRIGDSLASRETSPENLKDATLSGEAHPESRSGSAEGQDTTSSGGVKDGAHLLSVASSEVFAGVLSRLGLPSTSSSVAAARVEENPSSTQVSISSSDPRASPPDSLDETPPYTCENGTPGDPRKHASCSSSSDPRASPPDSVEDRPPKTQPRTPEHGHSSEPPPASLQNGAAAHLAAMPLAAAPERQQIPRRNQGSATGSRAAQGDVGGPFVAGEGAEPLRGGEGLHSYLRALPPNAWSACASSTVSPDLRHSVLFPPRMPEGPGQAHAQHNHPYQGEAPVSAFSKNSGNGCGGVPPPQLLRDDVVIEFSVKPRNPGSKSSKNSGKTGSSGGSSSDALQRGHLRKRLAGDETPARHAVSRDSRSNTQSNSNSSSDLTFGTSSRVKRIPSHARTFASSKHLAPTVRRDESTNGSKSQSQSGSSYEPRSDDFPALSSPGANAHDKGAGGQQEVLRAQTFERQQRQLDFGGGAASQNSSATTFRAEDLIFGTSLRTRERIARNQDSERSSPCRYPYPHMLVDDSSGGSKTMSGSSSEMRRCPLAAYDRSGTKSQSGSSSEPTGDEPSSSRPPYPNPTTSGDVRKALASGENGGDVLTSSIPCQQASEFPRPQQPQQEATPWSESQSGSPSEPGSDELLLGSQGAPARMTTRPPQPTTPLREEAGFRLKSDPVNARATGKPTRPPHPKTSSKTSTGKSCGSEADSSSKRSEGDVITFAVNVQATGERTCQPSRIPNSINQQDATTGCAFSAQAASQCSELIETPVEYLPSPNSNSRQPENDELEPQTEEDVVQNQFVGAGVPRAPVLAEASGGKMRDKAPRKRAATSAHAGETKKRSLGSFGSTTLTQSALYNREQGILRAESAARRALRGDLPPPSSPRGTASSPYLSSALALGGLVRKGKALYRKCYPLGASSTPGISVHAVLARSGQILAGKLLDYRSDPALEKLKKEARMLAKLSHPNIVSLVEARFEFLEDAAFFEELGDQGTLRNLINVLGSLPPWGVKLPSAAQLLCDPWFDPSSSGDDDESESSSDSNTSVPPDDVSSAFNHLPFVLSLLLAL